MSDKTREHISALMDDELGNGSQFVINAVKDDAEHRATWQRYHLIGEAVRGSLPEKIDLLMSERISAAISGETRMDNTGKQTKSVFTKPAVGFAIAASVAVMAILGVRQIGVGPNPAGVPQTQVVASSQDSNSVSNPLAGAAVTTVTVNPETRIYTPPADAETRLNRYLLDYNEYRTNAGVQGMLPYVRIVTHEVEQ
jgi:sigma-E factor negative regulatory protein RseA